MSTAVANNAAPNSLLQTRSKVCLLRNTGTAAGLKELDPSDTYSMNSIGYAPEKFFGLSLPLFKTNGKKMVSKVESI
jgi:hypothetical protein